MLKLIHYSNSNCQNWCAACAIGHIKNTCLASSPDLKYFLFFKKPSTFSVKTFQKPFTCNLLNQTRSQSNFTQSNSISFAEYACLQVRCWEWPFGRHVVIIKVSSNCGGVLNFQDFVSETPCSRVCRQNLKKKLPPDPEKLKWVDAKQVIFYVA